VYNTDQLSNGLRIVTHEDPSRLSVSLGIWVGVGGRYEDDRLKGSTHYLEHIVFKGSRKYTCEQIKESIEGVGGTLNAFTAEEQTCFFAKIPYQYFEQTFDILADMVFYPKINQKDVEKEKSVIIEEIKMYHDLPQYYVIELLDKMIWPNHPLGKGIAGSIESVSKLSSKDLKLFHNEYYQPGNIVVSACGRLDHAQFIDRIKEKFHHDSQAQLWHFKEASRATEEPQSTYHFKEIEQMHLALGIPGLDENHPDRYVMGLLSVILGGNMSSRLFVQVREKKGLAYAISGSTKYLHDTGLLMIRAGVDNVKIVDALKVILKELDKLKKEEVSEDEFKRAKDYFTGQLQLALEDTMDQMLFVGESLISKNKVRTFKSVVEKVEEITIADLKRVANDIFIENRYKLALVGPVTEEQRGQLDAVLKIKAPKSCSV